MAMCDQYRSSEYKPSKRRSDPLWRAMRHGKQRRIGLYGGSFDPVHAGHWQCAEQSRQRLRLHQVWWMVTSNPLKTKKQIAEQSYIQRMQMVQKNLDYRHAAAKGHRLVALHRDCRSVYTIDLLKRLRKRSHYRFYWLAGSDIIPQLPRWKQWRRLGRYVYLSFINRPGNIVRGAQHPGRRVVNRYLRGRKMALASSDLR